MTNVKEYGFYTVNSDYLKYLNKIDPEVYYNFCLSIKSKILKKVEKIYIRQKETGIIRRANCNFLKLEEAMKSWK